MDDLIVLHNLTAANLRHCLRMGGLAAPSLAICRADQALTRFGDISLLAPWRLADPRHGARVYAADVYTARYPQVEIEINRSALEQLTDRLAEDMRAMGLSGLFAESEITCNGRDYLSCHPAVMWSFLRARGIEVEPVWPQGIDAQRRQRLIDFGLGPWLDKTSVWDMLDDPAFAERALAEYRQTLRMAADGRPRSFALLQELERSPTYQRNVVRELAHKIARDAQDRLSPAIDESASALRFRQAIEEAGLIDAFDEHVQGLLDALTRRERIYLGMDRLGRRRYVDHTLEQVVRLMKKEIRGGEGFSYGLGSVRAYYAREFKSLQAVKQGRDRLVGMDEFEAVKKRLDQAFMDLCDEADPQMSLETFSHILQDARRLGLETAARQYGKHIAPEVARRIERFLESLEEQPTAYFEAKLLRVVQLGEFEAAVVPRGLRSVDLRALQGLYGEDRVWLYEDHDEASRRAVLAEAWQAVSESSAESSSESVDGSVDDGCRPRH